ncbi:MAG: amylo-alpha-1,6-glucosidase [Gemmatimonadaceae bacterium]
MTAYMAAVWIDALRALQPLARAMGDPSLASAAAKMCERALASVETRLRNPQDGLLALQLNHDGALNAVTTALSAVPIALGVETGHAADRTLARLTGPSFATPWGVRMLSSSDPRYNPSGYHFGAVWPLFTGWTALACYERGNASDGERLTKANAAIAWERARGAFDEVLHGETGNAAGVCPDQAWSAAMLVAPVVSGMWGVRPRDGATRLLVRPQLPHSWDHAMLSNVRVGESRVDLTLSQQPSGRGLTFTARRQHGTLAELQVELALGAVRDLRAGGDAATTVGRRVDESTPWVGWNLSLANSMATLTVEWSSP